MVENSGVTRRDVINFQAVNELGFESVYKLYSNYENLKMCPRCFSVVPTDFAEKHWWGQHQKVVYVSQSDNIFECVYIGDDVNVAGFYANVHPDAIVYPTVMDR